jgi:hypothetical protein
MATNKREREFQSMIFKKSSEKKRKLNSFKIFVEICNVPQFQELVNIAAGVNCHAGEIQVSENFIFFKIMGPSNISCFQAQFSCKTTGLENFKSLIIENTDDENESGKIVTENDEEKKTGDENDEKYVGGENNENNHGPDNGQRAMEILKDEIVKYGPFFIDMQIFQLSICGKHFFRNSNRNSTVQTTRQEQGGILEMRISPNNKITLSHRNCSVDDQSNNNSTVSNYSAKHVVRLLDDVSISLSLKSLEYNYNFKFLIFDLKAVICQMMQFKYENLSFYVYHNSNSNIFALRVSAKNIRHSSKHTFICLPFESNLSNNVPEMFCSTVSQSDSNSLEGDIKHGLMEIVCSQSFQCCHLYKILKSMTDNYMRISFNDGFPLCINYDFNPNSNAQYFLVPTASDDDELYGEMPPLPSDD